MAEFVYETSLSISGPWLLDYEALGSLDVLLDQEWEKLVAYRDKAIADEISSALLKITPRPDEDIQEVRNQIERMVRAGFEHRRSQREITIALKNGQKVRVHSFKEASNYPGIAQQVAVEFEVGLQCADIRCDISLSRDRNLLQIKASPEESHQSRDLFASLQQWVRKVEPTRWQKLWRQYADNSFFFVMIYTMTWMVLAAFFSPSSNYYKEQARELLSKGISANDQTRAIELILAIVSNSIPSSQQNLFPPLFWLYVATGYLLLLLPAVAPKTLMGIGKGTQRINIWRRWANFAFYLAPLAIIANLLWPLFRKTIEKFIGGG